MDQRRKTGLMVIGVGFGFSMLCFVLNAVLGATSPRLAQSFAFGISMGHAILVFGCIQVALSKGKPWYWGLLGLFSCLGVGILWFGVKDEAPAK